MSDQATIGVEAASGVFGLGVIGLGLYLWKYNPQTHGRRTTTGGFRRALRMRRTRRANGTRNA